MSVNRSSYSPLTEKKETSDATFPTEFIGHAVEHYREVASTNDVAIARGKAGAAEGTLIIAEHQTAGRGRYGRHWTAPHGKSLLVSVVFRHRLLRDQIALPNLVGAIAITEAIRTTLHLDARIKKPNDVRIQKKKVAGVLTELAYDAARHAFFVLGFGVNVNSSISDFPPELRETATSLRIAATDSEALSPEICRTDLLHAILSALEDAYLQLKAGDTAAITRRLRELCEDESGH